MANYAKDFIYGLDKGRELFHERPQEQRIQREQHRRAGESHRLAVDELERKEEEREAERASRMVRWGLFNDNGAEKGAGELTEADKSSLITAANSKAYGGWRQRHGITGPVKDGGVTPEGEVWMAYERGDDGQLGGYVVDFETFRDDVVHEAIKISPEFEEVHKQLAARRAQLDDLALMRGDGQRQGLATPEATSGSQRAQPRAEASSGGQPSGAPRGEGLGMARPEPIPAQSRQRPQQRAEVPNGIPYGPDYNASLEVGREAEPIPAQSRQRPQQRAEASAEPPPLVDGLSNDYVERLAEIESGGDLTAENPYSSAAGWFQWLDSTAEHYGVEPGNPRSELEGLAAFTEDNARVFRQRLGRDPAERESYLLHQQGAGGGSALLSRRDERAADVVGEDAVIDNGGDLSMTAGEFAEQQMLKYDDAQGVSIADNPTFDHITGGGTSRPERVPDTPSGKQEQRLAGLDGKIAQIGRGQGGASNNMPEPAPLNFDRASARDAVGGESSPGLREGYSGRGGVPDDVPDGEVTQAVMDEGAARPSIMAGLPQEWGARADHSALPRQRSGSEQETAPSLSNLPEAWVGRTDPSAAPAESSANERAGGQAEVEQRAASIIETADLGSTKEPVESGKPKLSNGGPNSKRTREERPPVGTLPGGGQLRVSEEQARAADRLLVDGAITSKEWDRFHKTGSISESSKGGCSWQNMGSGVWQTPECGIISEDEARLEVGLGPEQASPADEKEVIQLRRETDDEIAKLAGIDFESDFGTDKAHREMSQIKLAILGQGYRPVDFVKDPMNRELLRRIGPIQRRLNEEPSGGLLGIGRETQHRTAIMAHQIALSGGDVHNVDEHAQTIRQKYHHPVRVRGGDDLNPEQVAAYTNGIIRLERRFGEPLAAAQEVVTTFGAENNWDPDKLQVFLRSYAEGRQRRERE